MTLRLAIIVFSPRDYAAYTVIGGWSLTADQLVIGFSRLMYPFFAGVLMSRLKCIIPVRHCGFALSLFVAYSALKLYDQPLRTWLGKLGKR